MNEIFMREALKEAKKAFKNGEIPVGAVIAKDGQIIARGYNKREVNQNALLHAEIVAIDRACKKLKSFRLDGCSMFVTLEPCAMCSGAIINARIDNLYIGAKDLNYGCCGSKYNLVQDKAFEHFVNVNNGILKNECEKLLKDFFFKIREKNKLKKFLGKNIPIQWQENGLGVFTCGKEDVSCIAMNQDIKDEMKVIAIIDEIENMTMVYVTCGNSEEDNSVLPEDIFSLYKNKFNKNARKRIKIIMEGGEKFIF